MSTASRRSRVIVALLSVAILLATVASPGQAQSGPGNGGANGAADWPGWVSIGDDVVVPADTPDALRQPDRSGTGGPDGPSPLAVAGPATGFGYGLLSSAINWNLGSYTIRMVASAGIETIRPQVQSVATELATTTGGTYTVPAGTTTNTDPAFGEILVVVSSTSPCGGSGWSGCGGASWSGDTAVSGMIWINPSVTNVSPSALRHVVAHELGHAQGLGHFDSYYLGTLQTMRGSFSVPDAEYQQGDVNGLRSLYCDDQAFTDVGWAHLFCSEISWVSFAGVATGFGDGTYQPTASITRQAMAAFLYRLAGSPPGPFPDPGFSDVGPDHPFLNEISWLASTEITGGFIDGMFKSANPITRQAMAAFLYRMAGSPPGPFPDPGFSDVGPGNLFYAEISWLASTGVTAGFSDVTFRGADEVTRQAMAAFLWRFDAQQLIGI